MPKIPTSMFFKGGKTAGKDLFRDWGDFVKSAERTDPSDTEILRQTDSGMVDFVLDQASKLFDSSRWESNDLKNDMIDYFSKREMPESADQLTESIQSSPFNQRIEGLKLMGKAISQFESKAPEILQTFQSRNELAPVQSVKDYFSTLQVSGKQLSAAWDELLPEDDYTRLEDAQELRSHASPLNYLDSAHKQNSEQLLNKIDDPSKLLSLLDSAGAKELSLYPNEMAAIQSSPGAIENPKIAQKSESGIAMHLSKSIGDTDMAPSIKNKLLDVTLEVAKTAAIGVATGGLSIKSKVGMMAAEFVAEKAIGAGIDKLGKKFNGAINESSRSLDNQDMKQLTDNISQVIPKGEPNPDVEFSDDLIKLLEDVAYTLQHPGQELTNTPSPSQGMGQRPQR